MLEKTIESWKEFGSMVAGFKIGSVLPFPQYVFRGQADESWPLKPSLLRHIGDLPAAAALRIEQCAEQLFARSSQTHISPNLNSGSFQDRVMLMQHYGCPTRLLDWSGSAYIAAYFAVIEWPDEDGAVWLVHPVEMLRQFDSGAGAWEALSDHDMFVRKMVTDPDAEPFIDFFTRGAMTDRMVAQQGYVSMCRNIVGDHESVFSVADENKPDGLGVIFGKITIPSALKLDFLGHLQSMNIGANALFPGLDGVGRSVSELIVLEAGVQRAVARPDE